MMSDCMKNVDRSVDDNDDDDDVLLLHENGNYVKIANSSVLSDKNSIRRLCCYRNQEINTNDYMSLSDGEFLNDSVIAFYLTWLYNERLSISQQKSIYIFSSHFYTQMRRNVNSGRGGSTRSESMYLGVKRWTKKIDIFSKKMLLVPICEDAHWFMMLICNLSSVGLSLEEQIIAGKPFIVVFDSLGGNHADEVRHIRTYLQYEYHAQRRKTLSFDSQTFQTIEPHLPGQQNFSDCGVFLLHYTDKIFQDPSMFFLSKLGNLSKWFPSEEVSGKRQEIAKLIQTIAMEEHRRNSASSSNEDMIDFPLLHFCQSKETSILQTSASLKPKIIDSAVIDDKHKKCENKLEMLSKVHFLSSSPKLVSGGVEQYGSESPLSRLRKKKRERNLRKKNVLHKNDDVMTIHSSDSSSEDVEHNKLEKDNDLWGNIFALSKRQNSTVQYNPTNRTKMSSLLTDESLRQKLNSNKELCSLDRDVKSCYISIEHSDLKKSVNFCDSNKISGMNSTKSPYSEASGSEASSTRIIRRNGLSTPPAYKKYKIVK